MKNKIIALLKRNGFKRADVNNYANDIYCFSFGNGSIDVINNDGNYACSGLPMNYYAVVGFLYAELKNWNPIEL